MIASKHITKIVACLMAVLVCLCLCATGFSTQLVSAAGGLGVKMEYESKLFDTARVLEVNIIMDDADWRSMLDNAMSEEYVQCDVEIAGKTFYQVGIRPKGNTSLSTIVSDPDTDRYSFKLEFDQYVDGQTCFGLDKLILNNNNADATNMKEALIYDLYAYIGADASLYNYARVSVNGEYWGIYLALEAVEDSFMLRNYGAADGELYKPDSMNMGGGDRGNMPDMDDFDMGDMGFRNVQSSVNGDRANTETEQSPDADTSAAASDTQNPGADMRPDSFQRPGGDGELSDVGDFDFSEMFGGGGGFGGSVFGGGGANLNYSDEELDSYSTIWDGEVTDTNDSDHKRVVTALKNISEGTDLERYMDIDNLIRYAAVHIFSVNSDSLSGSMAHNYYLYETDGRLNILPWDYNLAFGGMGGGMSGGATDTVNSAIDDAWSSTNFFDTLLADEEYHAAYYEYMAQVVDYIQNGGFEAFYTRTRNMIDTLVETDPNAFFTYDEYLTAVETLYEFVALRGQSIQGQLDGSIPSTESGQRNSDALIDASHIDLSVMGSMNMGGMGGGRGGSADFGDFDFGGRNNTGGAERSAASEQPDASVVPLSGGSQLPQSGIEGSFDFNGELPDGFSGMELPDGTQLPDGMEVPDGMELPEGFDSSQFSGQMPGGFGQFSQGGASDTEEDSTADSEQSSQSWQRPDAGGMADMSTMFASGAGQSGGASASGLISYGLAAVILLAAFLFVLFYRRKPRKR